MEQSVMEQSVIERNVMDTKGRRSRFRQRLILSALVALVSLGAMLANAADESEPTPTSFTIKMDILADGSSCGFIGDVWGDDTSSK